MDEPTNHLDFTMLTWLEDYLSSYKGSVLIVSHDRYFLDKVADNICEIETEVCINIRAATAHFNSEGRENTPRRKEYEKQQSELAAMRDYVAKISLNLQAATA